MSQFIPLSIPNFEGNEKKYVLDALEQGWVSSAGMYVTEFEKKLAQYLKVPDVAVCQSGTSALHLSLICAGVGAKDVVLVSPLTFIAAVNPIRYQCAEPVFIDCDNSLCIDPVKLDDFCSNECSYDGTHLYYKGRCVKAIVVVHVFGNMAEMERIIKIAGKYNIKVIEDATEALGTKYEEGLYRGKYAGTIADFGAYSFNGNKIITTGGGGAVVAKGKKHVEYMRYLSMQAKDDPKKYCHNAIGYNYRMTNLQAALGVAQLEKLERYIARKNENYEIYRELLKNNRKVRLMPFRDHIRSNKWFYSLEFMGDIEVEEIVKKLDEMGIQTRTIWQLINEQLPYQEFDTFKLNKSLYYVSHVINVPCSTQLTKKQIVFIVQSVNRIVGE